ncbi:MAG: hypothetical protein V3T64_00985 [Myxococcota bacterium]
MTRIDAVTTRGNENPEGFHPLNAVLISGTLIFGLLWGLLVATPAAAESVPPAALEFSPIEFSPNPLDDLLAVPDLGIAWTEESGDEALLAAIALGNDPDLERRDPFRKRSRDLFSTERPVVIGRAEMLLRLRLRPSARKAMSVELRF